MLKLALKVTSAPLWMRCPTSFQSPDMAAKCKTDDSTCTPGMKSTRKGMETNAPCLISQLGIPGSERSLCPFSINARWSGVIELLPILLLTCTCSFTLAPYLTSRLSNGACLNVAAICKAVKLILIE